MYTVGSVTATQRGLSNTVSDNGCILHKSTMVNINNGRNKKILHRSSMNKCNKLYRLTSSNVSMVILSKGWNLS